jgi:hypothetical protein
MAPPTPKNQPPVGNKKFNYGHYDERYGKSAPKDEKRL